MSRSSVNRIRTSSIPPSPDSNIHLGWQRLKAALRGAGLLSGLTRSSLKNRLGPAAGLRPSREAVFDLIDRYLLEQDSPSEGRYLVYRESQPDSARQIVSRLASILPELSCLTLVEESNEAGSIFVLRTRRAYARLPGDAIAKERVSTRTHTAYVRRTITVDALVEAANRLLHFRAIPVRLLPIWAPSGVAAYLGADPVGAAMLNDVELWDAEPDELTEFGYIAEWGRLSRSAEDASITAA